jgi:hypothetical protein
MNAVSESIELATRALVEDARASGSADNFIQELLKKYGVRVHTLDLSALPVQIAQFPIVSVHQQFEVFLREFRTEHPQTTWEAEKGDDRLTAIFRNLGTGYANTVSQVGRLEVDLVDHYRLVRDKFIHLLERGAQSISMP